MTIRRVIRSTCLQLVAACILVSVAVSAQEQNYTEWSAETRTSLGFHANARAVRSLLPEGWTVAAIANTPDKVSLTVTFMDRHMVMNPQGEPVGTGTSRYMVMSVQARNADNQSSTLIINGISPEGIGSYEVYQTAVTASAERALSGQLEQTSTVQETWEMVADSGDRISLNLGYQQGIPVRRQSRIVIRSGKNIGFTRTYKIDQASDVLGRPGDAGSRLQSVNFSVSGPLYSRLFDGTEVLTGITSTPWYNREIYIP